VGGPGSAFAERAHRVVVARGGSSTSVALAWHSEPVKNSRTHRRESAQMISGASGFRVGQHPRAGPATPRSRASTRAPVNFVVLERRRALLESATRAAPDHTERVSERVRVRISVRVGERVGVRVGERVGVRVAERVGVRVAERRRRIRLCIPLGPPQLDPAAVPRSSQCVRPSAIRTGAATNSLRATHDHSSASDPSTR